MGMPSEGSGARFTGLLQPILSITGLLVLAAFVYFAAWQLAVALTLIAAGLFMWWRNREPGQGRDRAA